MLCKFLEAWVRILRLDYGLKNSQRFVYISGQHLFFALPQHSQISYTFVTCDKYV